MSFSDFTPDFTPPTPGQHADNVIPRFYLKPEKSIFKSEREGKPVFEDREMVEIRVPGDRKTEVHSYVKEEHKRRWPQYYAAFKAQQEAPTEGTPLAEWPKVTRSQVEELGFFHIKTVEQLANLSDDQLSKCLPMGGFPLRDAAKRMLEQAAGSAPAEKLAAENSELRGTMEAMKAQMDAMREQMDKMVAATANAAPLALTNAEPAPIIAPSLSDQLGQSE